MSGYIPRSQNDGLSIAHNRVVNPTVSSFTEVYTSLPEDMWLGFPAEGNGIKAVLCRAGGTALVANRVVQASGDSFRSDTIVGNSGPTFQQVEGDTEIYVTQSGIAENEWKGGKVWINGHSRHVPYTIIRNTASADVSDGATSPADVNNVVTITLDPPLTAAAGNALAVVIDNRFGQAAAATANSNKVLGLTLAAVPANNYFWAVYSGRLFQPFTSAVAEAGDYLKKAVFHATNAPQGFNKVTITVSSNVDDFDAEIIGRASAGNFIELDVYHPGLP